MFLKKIRKLCLLVLSKTLKGIRCVRIDNRKFLRAPVLGPNNIFSVKLITFGAKGAPNLVSKCFNSKKKICTFA